MGSKSTSQANQTSSVIDNRIAAGGDGNALQFQGGITFQNLIQSAKSNPAVADPTASPNTSAQSVVYTEGGGISLVGNSNKILQTDFGAINSAKQVSQSALDLVAKTTEGFTKSLSGVLASQNELALSAQTGGDSTSQKNFVWLAVGAFALIAWINRK